MFQVNKALSNVAKQPVQRSYPVCGVCGILWQRSVEGFAQWADLATKSAEENEHQAVHGERQGAHRRMWRPPNENHPFLILSPFKHTATQKSQ
jgi:hypothetical protein